MIEYLVLQEGVQPGIIDAAGLAVGVASILIAAVWLHYLYR